MRICLVYDCLFPHTVGGAERWYRSLAERLAADGHEVTYLTLRQWDRGADPGVPGVDVRRRSGRGWQLYDGAGPPADPAAARLRRRGAVAPAARTDAATTSSTPARSPTSRCWPRRCARRTLRLSAGRRLVRGVEPRATGGSTSAAPADVGWLVQRLCVRVRQRAFCFSRLYARSLRDEGLRGEITMLAGAYDGPLEPRAGSGGRAAGRVRRSPHPGEARARHPAGDRARCASACRSCGRRSSATDPTRGDAAGVERLGLEDVVDLPGFVADRGRRGCDRPRAVPAAALPARGLRPRRRRGRRPAARPSVVVAGPDNAAVELMRGGRQRLRRRLGAPEDLAAAIDAVAAGGEALRALDARLVRRQRRADCRSGVRWRSRSRVYAATARS